MDCFPCCTRFWNGLFSMLCRHPCRSWFDAWPGSSPSSLASRWCENWTESSPCWGTAGNEARRMWWDMLDWIALADTRMQTVSHACRHTYALSAALRRMLRSSQLNTQLFSCGEICWIEYLLQTVAHACKHMYAVSHLQENASLIRVEHTALFMWWDMLDWTSFADTCMQTVARACKHMYAVSHLQENASLCWVESTALFVWRDRCFGLQTLYWQRQADSYMCIVCTVSASVRRVFSFLSWDAAENAALLMWGIFGQMPFNLRACTQSHVIHSCMHMHWHTYNKHTTHACTHTNTPTTHPFTHSAGKYLKINLSAVTLAFILSFVILEIRCASPVFSWRCTRQTDASPSWRSKPWSWRWERAFSSTSGCPRWIVYSLLAPRCVCLACLLFLILQAGSWPFLFDYCSTFLQQYPLLSLWVPDISSVGSWSSYGMGMCVCVCVCICMYVCAYVCMCV